MPKYRNDGDFFQTLTIGGKRTHIKPGDVFFSDRELDLKIYDALVRVPDDTVAVAPIIKKQAVAPVNMESNKKLEDELNSLKKSIANLMTQSAVDEKIKKAKEEILEKTPQVEAAEIDGMVGKVKELEDLCKILKDNKQVVDLIDTVTKMSEELKVVLRRQEVLKKAIDTVNGAVKRVEEEVYMNSNVVVIDEEDKNEISSNG